MKYRSSIASIILGGCLPIQIFAQNLRDRKGHEETSDFLGIFFSVMVVLAVLSMVYALYKVIYVEGKLINDVTERIVACFIGLLIALGIDVFGKLELSELLVQTFADIKKDDISTYIPPIGITALFAIFGAFVSWRVQIKMRDSVIGRRLFVLISTVIMFFLIRIYVVASENSANKNAMIANLAFIVGYGIIIITNPKKQEQTT